MSEETPPAEGPMVDEPTPPDAGADVPSSTDALPSDGAPPSSDSLLDASPAAPRPASGADFLRAIAGPDGLDDSPAPDPLGASLRAVRVPAHRARHLDVLWWNFFGAAPLLAFLAAELPVVALLLTPWLLVTGYKVTEVQCRTIATEWGEPFENLHPGRYLILSLIVGFLWGVAWVLTWALMAGFSVLFDEIGDWYVEAELAALLLVAPLCWYLASFVLALWGRGLVALTSGERSWLADTFINAGRSILRPVSTELRFVLYAVLMTFVLLLPFWFAADPDMDEVAGFGAVVIWVVVSTHLAIAFPVYMAHRRNGVL